MTPATNLPRTRHGLTLLEVMLGLALMVLIAGGVVSIVQSSLISTTIAQQVFQQEEMEGSVFAYFRHLFFNLPPTVSFETAPDPSEDIVQQLQFHNAPELFSWGKGREGPPDTQVLLSTRIHKDGTYSLILEKRLLHASRNFIRKEIVLLEGLQKLEWGFYDPLDRKWKSDWRTREQRPGAIRMSLHIGVGEDPLDAVFQISPAAPRIPSPAPAPTDG